MALLLLLRNIDMTQNFSFDLYHIKAESSEYFHIITFQKQNSAQFNFHHPVRHINIGLPEISRQPQMQSQRDGAVWKWHTMADASAFFAFACLVRFCFPFLFYVQPAEITAKIQPKRRVVARDRAQTDQTLTNNTVCTTLRDTPRRLKIVKILVLCTLCSILMEVALPLVCH